MLHGKALFVGDLLADAETGATLHRDTCAETLISATDHWTTHPEAGRRATINSGISNGISRASQGVDWLQSAKDRCLGIFDRSTDKPADNIRELVPVEEAREVTMQAIKSAFSQRKAIAEAEEGFVVARTRKERKAKKANLKALTDERDALLSYNKGHADENDSDLKTARMNRLAELDRPIATYTDAPNFVDVFKQITSMRV